MGWYTELKIGKNYWSWRKTLPIEVPLLFYGRHKTIEVDIANLNSESTDFVGFEASVMQVISNLDKLGLTLDFFISTYSTYRAGIINWCLGLLAGRESVYCSLNEIEKKKKTQKQIERIKNSSPSKDIHSAIKILKENIKIDSHLIDDESLIPSLDNAHFNTDLDRPDIIEALTFGTFLTYAYENLPEIAWLYEIRLILSTVNTRTKVKLDMKEWVMEGLDMDVIKDSIESLGLKAKTYSKTFDAILGGEQTYNKEYERVKLLDNWKKLNSLRDNDISKGSQLEDFISVLFHKKFGFEVVSKRLLVETQELDIVLKNVSKNDFIKSLNSPFIIIECKNWVSPVGVSEARIFESKYRDVGKKVNMGIFIALNGITKPFKSHVNNLVRDGINLIIIDNKNIEDYLYSENLDIGIWLETLISDQFILK